MVWRGAVRRGEAGFGKARRGMGLIADRGLEIVLLRVLRHLAWTGMEGSGGAWSGSVWWGMARNW
jgi:hypothetical protein